MIGKHREMLLELVAVGERLGFAPLSDADWKARLERGDGAAIEMTADQPSYPAFTLYFLPPKTGTIQRRYALWLLMRSQMPNVAPTWGAQLRFIESSMNRLLSDEAAYRDAYLASEHDMSA